MALRLRATRYPKARLIIGLAARAPGAPLHRVEHILSEPSARVMALAPLSAEAVEAPATDYFSLPAEEAFVRA